MRSEVAKLMHALNRISLDQPRVRYEPIAARLWPAAFSSSDRLAAAGVSVQDGTPWASHVFSVGTLLYSGPWCVLKDALF